MTFPRVSHFAHIAQFFLNGFRSIFVPSDEDTRHLLRTIAEARRRISGDLS